MTPYELSRTEMVVGILIVVGLVALSLYYAQRQFASLRGLRDQADSLDEEVRYERRKARGRLVSCVLTLLLAVLIATLLASWDATFVRVAKERQADPAAERTDEQRFLIRVWGGQCIAVLLVMLSILVLAALDVWATRRFAISQFRKISEDRRAMIQGEVNRIRAQRNGEH